MRSLAMHGLKVYAVCNTAMGQAAHSRYAAGAWVLDRRPDAPPTEDQVIALAENQSFSSLKETTICPLVSGTTPVKLAPGCG